MKFTAHVGLGKTGTSAIQTALYHYKGSLNTPKTWGWPKLANGNKIDHKWLASPHTSDKTGALYRTIVAHSKKTGCDHIVWSNEAISSNPEMIKLFAELLNWSPDLDVQIVIYVREPGQWLKSAWEQWGLQDKVLKGKVHAKHNRNPLTFCKWFKSWGSTIYNNWKRWKGIANVRTYKEGGNVIDDFCDVTGLDLPRIRAYETPTSAEVLSRAIYNNTYAGTVTPHKFDFYTTYGSIDDYSKRYFSLNNIEKFQQILKANSDLFPDAEVPEERKISEDDYRKLLDQAIIFSIEAIGRIDQLEGKLRRLTKEKETED